MRRVIVAATCLAAIALGTGASCPPSTVVSDVTIGLQAAICVLNTYSADIAGGKSEVNAIEDCVLKCGVSAAQAGGVLEAHKAALVKEGAVK